MALLTTKDIADRFGQSLPTARRWCALGRIPGAHKLGRDWFVEEGALEGWQPPKKGAPPKAERAVRDDTRIPGRRMRHRHLDHQRLTLAAVDDLIERGDWEDWTRLRAAGKADPAVLDKILRVCRARTHTPFAQRHHFWARYAEAHLA